MKPYNKINKLQDLEDEKTKNLIIELILSGDVELIRLDCRFLEMLETEYKKQPLLKPLIEATLKNKKLEEKFEYEILNKQMDEISKKIKYIETSKIQKNKKNVVYICNNEDEEDYKDEERKPISIFWNYKDKLINHFMNSHYNNSNIYDFKFFLDFGFMDIVKKIFKWNYGQRIYFYTKTNSDGYFNIWRETEDIGLNYCINENGYIETKIYNMTIETTRTLIFDCNYNRKQKKINDKKNIKEIEVKKTTTEHINLFLGIIKCLKRQIQENKIENVNEIFDDLGDNINTIQKMKMYKDIIRAFITQEEEDLLIRNINIIDEFVQRHTKEEETQDDYIFNVISNVGFDEEDFDEEEEFDFEKWIIHIKNKIDEYKEEIDDTKADFENALDDIQILNDDIEELQKENKQLKKEDN